MKISVQAPTLITSLVFDGKRVCNCNICHYFFCYRLNTIQYTPTSETAGYNGNAHHMIASNAKGPPSNSHFTPTDLQTGFVEVKQIEQDALRKSPAEIMAQQNGQILFQGCKLIHLTLPL